MDIVVERRLRLSLVRKYRRLLWAACARFPRRRARIRRGFVIGVGRISSAAAPAFAGWMLSAGLDRMWASMVMGSCAIAVTAILAFKYQEPVFLAGQTFRKRESQNSVPISSLNDAAPLPRCPAATRHLTAD